MEDGSTYIGTFLKPDVPGLVPGRPGSGSVIGTEGPQLAEVEGELKPQRGYKTFM